MELDCPRCKIGKLEELEVDGILIDRCRVCGGLWFDSGELTQVSGDDESVRETESQIPDEQTHMDCPRCEQTTMRKQRLCDAGQQEHDIFRCPSCLGSWIDRGVLSGTEDKNIAQNTRACFSKMRVK
ncbi:MAG: zf-TFIIB domain-containing protein [Deltaproteobacteria bacterium]|nr:zf-TFIIB domain-containing protein [Deltaproteobacteria bacterium]